jgi:glucan biosynthesis protein C
MNDISAAARLHYMDAMRSVLMLLGVVLHSARPYDSGVWLVKDTARLSLLDALVSTIHLFRMPAFFVVAGYFAMYLLLRRPTSVFLRERLRRVLIPLLSMLLTFNLVEVWLVAGTGGEAGFVQGVLLPAWASGRWVSHLWFLVTLAVCFTLVAGLAPWLRRLAGAPVQASRWLGSRWLLASILGVGVMTPLAVAVLGKLTAPALDTAVLGMISTNVVLRYLPFFAVGMMLCVEPGLIDRFARRELLVLGLAFCGLGGLYLTDGRVQVAYRAINIVSGALLTWMAVRVVFSLFRDWTNRPSPTFEYLSYASYSIYLFHHLVVIATATALLSVPLGAGVKFLIVLAIASMVPLAIHHFLIRRYDALGYLFNGRVGPGRSATIIPATPGMPLQPEMPSSVPAAWPAVDGADAGTAGSPDPRLPRGDDA